MKTILQKIGPLYGEAVNGTVFGQPNGSQSIPKINTIDLTVNPNFAYVTEKTISGNTRAVVCDSNGATGNGAYGVFALQTAAAVLAVAIYSDSACTTLVHRGTITTNAYGATWTAGAIPSGINSGTITQGTTYYVRFEAWADSGCTALIVASDNVVLEGV